MKKKSNENIFIYLRIHEYIFSIPSTTTNWILQSYVGLTYM